MAQKDTNPYIFSDSNKRYMTYDWYMKQRFGGKVAKVTVDNRGDGSVKPQPKKSDKKPGRNDPCPCGSGKKYKKCCGMNE